MPQERRRTATFFGLGSAAVILLVGAGYALKAPHDTTDGGTNGIPRTPPTFQAMERPDPVLLLTPVRLPDRRFANR